MSYPCTVITEADVTACEQEIEAVNKVGDTRWVDDGKIAKHQLRWNGLLAEIVACRRLNVRSLAIWNGGWDRGLDFRTAGGSWQVKFRSASRYGLSRPLHAGRLRANWTLLMVPACDWLDGKQLEAHDELCFAGWVSTKEFYQRATERVFFGKPHLFMDQPLRPIDSHPDLAPLV